ncbi:MAG: ABC transporter substrate-binding protein [Bifidobacteriaceae bacterium]|jgi:polar amino acid transport system substrate-binding protein|nr:ABC transporter substrate-binding protein [Bifidobacteriaceae bacterium]
MKSKLIKLTSLFAAGVLALSTVGCSSEVEPSDSGSETPAPSESASEQTLETVVPGKLTIATGEPAYEPWVVNDDPASCEGFEAAVGCEIGKRLGFAPGDIVWVRTGFEEAIAPGPKDFDFNIQQYTPTEERKASVDFSSEYAHFPQAVVVKSDGKFADVKSTEELKSALIGVPQGTTEYDIAVEFFGEAPVQVFNDLDATVQALINDQVDAIVADVSSAWYISTAELENGKIAGILEGTEGEGCAALLAKDSPLTTPVSKVIDEMNADGTIKALQEKWLYDTSTVPTLSK